MVNSNLHWTENRLSDTVVEFKASINKKRNIINELIIGNFHYNLHYYYYIYMIIIIVIISS